MVSRLLIRIVFKHALELLSQIGYLCFIFVPQAVLVYLLPQFHQLVEYHLVCTDLAQVSESHDVGRKLVNQVPVVLRSLQPKFHLLEALMSRVRRSQKIIDELEDARGCRAEARIKHPETLALLDASRHLCLHDERFKSEAVDVDALRSEPKHIVRRADNGLGV